jgi:hypothetical protein
MTRKDIFDFNPITAIFLSGYATHLYTLICYQQQKNKKILIEAGLLISSKKRISRWNVIFLHFCMHHYQSYLLDHEKEVLHQTGTPPPTTSNSKNPFYIHVQLLIKASQILTHVSSLSANSPQAPNKRTKSLISVWFTIVKKVTTSFLGARFPEESKEILITILEKRNKTTDTNIYGKTSYPHFSPGALFTRCSFIVYMQKSTMDESLFNHWEVLNAALLSRVMSVTQFLNDPHPKMGERHLNGNTPSFPYIHNLPRSALFAQWDDFAETSSPIPIGKFFTTMLQCIHGYACTYHNEHLSSVTENSEVMIGSFQELLREIFPLLQIEISKVKNNEKQRNFQSKKRGEKRPRDRTESFSGELSMNFLFGINNCMVFNDFDDSKNCDIERNEKSAC